MIVTVLTGRRPDLLDRCLHTIHKATVFVNGNDPASIAVAEAHGATVEGWDGWLSVGESMTRIAEWVGEHDGYWLHVEDDWEATGPIPLEEAIELLERRPDVGQVRLRKRSDGALRRNYLTGQRIVYDPDGVGNAHATWNPTVSRTSDSRFYPVSGEVEFMGNHAEVYQVNAQLEGVFTHIGKGRSLR